MLHWEMTGFGIGLEFGPQEWELTRNCRVLDSDLA